MRAPVSAPQVATRNEKRRPDHREVHFRTQGAPSSQYTPLIIVEERLRSRVPVKFHGYRVFSRPPFALLI
jgi:hypothetical protein